MKKIISYVKIFYRLIESDLIKIRFENNLKLIKKIKVIILTYFITLCLVNNY